MAAQRTNSRNTFAGFECLPFPRMFLSQPHSDRGHPYPLGRCSSRWSKFAPVNELARVRSDYKRARTGTFPFKTKRPTANGQRPSNSNCLNGKRGRDTHTTEPLNKYNEYAIRKHIMEISAKKFEGLSYRELQKAAKSKGLNAGGKRGDILRRLKQVSAYGVHVQAPRQSQKRRRAQLPVMRRRENKPTMYG